MAPLAHVHAYKSVHTAAYLLSTGLYPVRATIPRVYVCTYIFTPLHVFLPRWYVAASANIAIRTRITETGAPPGIRRRRTTTTTIEFGSIFLPPPPPNLLDFLVYYFSNYYEMIISRVLNLRISLLIRENFRSRVKIRQTKHHPACIRPRKS